MHKLILRKKLRFPLIAKPLVQMGPRNRIKLMYLIFNNVRRISNSRGTDGVLFKVYVAGSCVKRKSGVRHFRKELGIFKRVFLPFSKISSKSADNDIEIGDNDGKERAEMPCESFGAEIAKATREVTHLKSV